MFRTYENQHIQDKLHIQLNSIPSAASAQYVVGKKTKTHVKIKQIMSTKPYKESTIVVHSIKRSIDA